MKKITQVLFSFAMLFTLAQCNNTAPDELTGNADSRAKTISILINNDAYMNQVMDSRRSKHPDVILSAIFIMAKSDKQMQGKMMDKMTDMCKMDPSTCKMMMDKTMKRGNGR